VFGKEAHIRSANALTLHYTRNDCTIDEGDVGFSIQVPVSGLTFIQMILLDAGCEVGMYASDITRTFPANGEFTGPQRDLYEVVLNVQKSLIKKCTIEESISLHELQRLSESRTSLYIRVEARLSR
jgi:intermediate cleaving peptidase 55